MGLTKSLSTTTLNSFLLPIRSGGIVSVYASTATFTVDSATGIHVGDRFKATGGADRYGTVADISGLTITAEGITDSVGATQNLHASMSKVYFGYNSDTDSPINSAQIVNLKTTAKKLKVRSGKILIIGGTDGGTFYGVTGAAPGTYADDGGSYCGTKFIPTGGDGSSVWKRLYVGEVDIVWFGAILDGITDNYTAIMNSVANDRTVRIPDGTCVVGTRLNLTAYSGLNIVGSKTSVLKQKDSSNLAGLITLGTRSHIFGVTLDGNSAANVAGSAGSLRPHCVNLAGDYGSVQNCSIKNVSNASAIAICNITSSVGGPVNCRVANNSIESFELNGIDNLYSDGTVVSNNIVYNDDTAFSANAGSGIQWWGGDAAIEGITTTVNNLTIVGNFVRGVAYGGIWGSQGYYVTVVGNTVRKCNDVGIDFEGGKNFACSGNVVENCINAGISTFYGASQGTILGNQVFINSASGLRYGIALNFNNNEHFTGGGSVDIIHKNIVISGNQITSDITSPSIRGGVYIGLQCRDIVVGENELYNCIIDLYRSMRLRVRENKLVIDNFATSLIGIPMDGVMDSDVSNNELRRTSDTLGNSAAITLSYGSAVWTGIGNRIVGNTIIGWYHSIYDSILNGGASASTAIENNRVSGTIRRFEGNTWEGNCTNNRDYTVPANLIPMEFRTAPSSDRPTFPTSGYIQTGGATATTLATFTLPDNTALLVRAYVTATSSDLANRAAYIVSALVYRDGGTATIQGSVISDFSQESVAGLDCTIVVTGNTAVVQVTGIAATIYNWNGKFDLQTQL